MSGAAPRGAAPGTVTERPSGQRAEAVPTAMHDVLRQVVAWTTATVRGAWAAYGLLSLVISWTMDELPPAAAPAAAMGAAWAAALIALARRRRALPPWVAGVDLLMSAAFLLGEGLLVPASLVGDGTSWVFTGATMSVLVAGLLLRPARALAATAALVVAYLVGIAASGGDPRGPDGPATSAVLVTVGVLAVVMLATLRRSADRADEALAHSVAAERADLLMDRESRERESQERLLHDHVRAVLWLIGDGHLAHRVAAAREGSAKALTVLRELAAGRLVTLRSRSVDEAVEAAVRWAREVGLDVTVVHEGGGDRPSAGARGGSDLPGVVVTAVGEALRQALLNIHRHSGSTSARVVVHVRPRFVHVTVLDEGRGFTPSSVDAAGQGLRRSIIGRMAEIGGTAEIDSRPGHGTRVVLRWQGGDGTGTAAASPDVVSGALRAYDGGFIRTITVVAIAFHLLSLFAALQLPGDYRLAPLSLGCWAVMLTAGVLLGVGGPRMTPPRARIAVAAVLAASTTVVLNCWPPGILGFANWAFGDSVWPLTFAMALLPLSEVVCAMAALDVVQAVVMGLAVTPQASDMTKLLGVLVSNAMNQVAVVAGQAFVRRATVATSRSVWRADAAAAALAAREAAVRARVRRAESLDRRIVSLLESVVGGQRLPSDTALQRELRAAGAALRREDALSGATKPVEDVSRLARRAADTGVHLELAGTPVFDLLTGAQRTRVIDLLDRIMPLLEPGRALVTAQTGDLTVPDWEADASAQDESALSITLCCPISAGVTTALHGILRTTVPTLGARSSFDVEFDEPTAANATGATEPGRSSVVHMWMAVALHQ